MTQLNFNAGNVRPFKAAPDIEDQKRDTTRVWSPYQEDVFSFVAHGQGNAIVEAVAGSGKSTTIVEAMKLAGMSSLFLAFNKSIADELKKRGVNARTFHSMTYSPVLRLVGANTVTQNKTQMVMLNNSTEREYMLYRNFVGKMIGLAKQMGVGCLVPDTDDVWLGLAAHHDVQPESEEADIGEGIELCSKVLTLCNQSNTVDFDDMLYLAVLRNVRLQAYDFVFVDEAQDTNAIQRALLHKVLTPSGRMVAVGDPAQAIYGFRGADSSSLANIAREFNAITLPLSISYRCSRAVVEYARKWVGHIEACDGAPEGEVVSLGQDWQPEDIGADDLVVCRKSAPLLSLAYKLARRRIPANIMGKDLGAGLSSIVRKTNAVTIDDLEGKLDTFFRREINKAEVKEDEQKVEALNDRWGMLRVIINNLPENNRTVDALLQEITTLFSPKINGIKLATIHKAKGLEADKVWWLGRDECPAKWAKRDWQKQQEVNLCYVAATRAKTTLVTFEL